MKVFMLRYDITNSHAVSISGDKIKEDDLRRNVARMRVARYAYTTFVAKIKGYKPTGIPRRAPRDANKMNRK